MKNPFKGIPLGARYALGLCLVLITGFIMVFGTQVSSRDYRTLWEIVTISAIIHWLVSGTYIFWERRWYRFFALGFSSLATGFYIDMTMNIWKQA